MPTYVTLVRYTNQGIRNIKESPARLEAAKKAAQSIGTEIKSFYLALGTHDIVLTTEAPNDETAARLVLSIGSLGNVRTGADARLHRDRVPEADRLVALRGVGGRGAVSATCRSTSAPRGSPTRSTLDIMATDDEMRAELERLKTENEALKARRSGATSMKVSEKGGLSVYGLGRFPVTLYQEQWVKLLDLGDRIRAWSVSID